MLISMLKLSCLKTVSTAIEDSMKITINDQEVNLQEGDSVQVNQYPCDMCGTHTEVRVERDKKEIAHFGDYVTGILKIPENIKEVL